VDEDNLRFSEVAGDDPEEELRDMLNEDEYIEAMHSLGITPVIDI
jgi:hypothetical protein